MTQRAKFEGWKMEGYPPPIGSVRGGDFRGRQDEVASQIDPDLSAVSRKMEQHGRSSGDDPVKLYSHDRAMDAGGMIHLTKSEGKKLVKLLGLYQGLLESAIDSNLIAGTAVAMKGSEANVRADRRDWQAAEAMVKALISRHPEVVR